MHKHRNLFERLHELDERLHAMDVETESAEAWEELRAVAAEQAALRGEIEVLIDTYEAAAQ